MSEATTNGLPVAIVVDALDAPTCRGTGQHATRLHRDRGDGTPACDQSAMASPTWTGVDHPDRLLHFGRWDLCEDPDCFSELIATSRERHAATPRTIADGGSGGGH